MLNCKKHVFLQTKEVFNKEQESWKQENSLSTM